MEIGHKFKKAYPFFLVKGDPTNSIFGIGIDDLWVAGCAESREDGCEIGDGIYENSIYYTCDAEGEIEYEVLAVVDMPRKMKRRVIYTTRLTDPDGNVRKASSAKMATITKFNKWADAIHTSYQKDYSVNY